MFWLKGSMLVGAFGILTAWAVFPVAWRFRHKGKDSKLWWWMDDERFDSTTPHGYAKDYFSFILKYKDIVPNIEDENFWIAYKWHIRNSVWNLKRTKFLVDSTPAEVGNNNIDNVVIVKNTLVKLNENGTITELDPTGVWIMSPGLKYLPQRPDEDIWQVNQGDTISYKTSILGEVEMWFTPKGKTQVMFRKSHCKIVRYRIFWITLWMGWRTFKYGYGNKSYVLTLKHQKIKPWG